VPPKLCPRLRKDAFQNFVSSKAELNYLQILMEQQGDASRLSELAVLRHDFQEKSQIWSFSTVAFEYMYLNQE
jgi:hypothetical protein